jgi:hypothetical protein
MAKTIESIEAIATSVPVFASLLLKLQKANGWTVTGLKAESNKGIVVALARNNQAILISNEGGSTRLPVKDLTVNQAVKAIVDFNQRDKTSIKPVPVSPVANKTSEVTQMNTATTAKSIVEKATGKKATGKKAPVATGQKAPVAPPVKEEKVKVIGKPVVNPAGKATPVFDALKATVETDKKVKAKLEETWNQFGEKYEFKVGNLTKALLAEGLWPSAVDKDGDFKAGDDGLQIPVGYQKVYKQEKESETKGIGHMVNVAAASFGRHNMTRAITDKPDVGDGTTTTGEETLDEKQINKRLVQLEKLVISLPADVVKEWLDNSKALRPIMEAYMEEQKTLEALEV